MSPRAAWAVRNLWITAALAAGIAAAVLVLAGGLRLRLDLTEDGEYTLAPSTVAMLVGLEDRLQVRLFFNRDIEGAESILPARIIIEDLLTEMQAAAGGRMAVETVDPSADAAAQAEAEFVGITPVPITGQSRTSLSVSQLFQGLTLRYAGRDRVIPVVVPDQFEFVFAAALSDLVREERPVVGFASREPAGPPDIPGMPEAPPPAGRIFAELRRAVGDRYDWRDVQLDRPEALDGISALLLLRPEDLTRAELEGLENYLCGGGHLAVFADFEDVTDPFLPSLERRDLDPGVTAWLQTLGVHLKEQFLIDGRGTPTNVPAFVDLGGGRRQRVMRRVPNGLWPLLQGVESLSPAHIVTAHQPMLVTLWAHPVTVFQPPPGVKAEWLLRTSAQAWMLPRDIALEGSIENLEQVQRRAMGLSAARAYEIGVILTGEFPRILGTAGAVEPGVLLVVGDADLLRNGVLQGDNRAFASNLVDWLVQDESLIAIRSRGRTDRRLADFYEEWMEVEGLHELQLSPEELQEADRDANAYRRSRERRIAWANVGLPPLLILAAGFARWALQRRRGRRPWRPAAGGRE